MDFDLSDLHPARVPAAPPAPRTLPRVLFVCSGNVCRSPLAELVLSARLGGGLFDVMSAGTHALVGHPMPAESVALALARGVDPETAAAHRGTWLTEEHAHTADLVLTMDRSQRRHVVELAPSRVSRIFTLREFARVTTGFDDAAVHAAAAGTGRRAGLPLVLRQVSARRTETPPPAEPQDDDVVDPFGRSVETYERSAAQIDPALAEVERILRLSLARLD